MNKGKHSLLPSNFKNVDLKNDVLPRNEKIEWWFVQGYFKGASVEKRHFMCALFRQRHGRNKHGFALIQTLFDPKTKIYQSYVQTDQDELDLFLEGKKTLTKSNLYAHFIQSYFDEIKRYGLPHPVVLEKSKAKITSAPFEIDWKNFNLAQKKDGLSLSFLMPGQKKGSKFSLEPNGICCSSEPENSPSKKKTMAYLSYPRMSLKGKFEGKPVSGEAWFDHQWGGYGWFSLNLEGGNVLGWDWLGVNLDDGSDMWVMIQRNMKTNKIVKKQAVLRKSNGEILSTEKFRAEKTGSWQSNRTRIKYPVRWRFSIPEFDAEFTFDPFIEDQEIKLFAVIRAVWDGMGTVKGKVGNKKVSGRAWLELQGYGYIFDFQSYLEKYVASIDKCIEKYLPKKISEKDMRRYIGPAIWKRSPDIHTEMLSKPVWDLLSRKGKHWRPVFGLLMLEALGVESEKYELLLSVILELSHSGALIIDDIEDDSLVRRNDKCIHRRYGVDVAINVGNMLYFIPYLLIKDYPGLDKAQQLGVYEIMVSVWVRAHFGQAQDIYWTRANSPEALKKWMKGDFHKELFEMYRYKTAAAVEGVAELCAIISNADEKTRLALVKLARIFGVSFQIIDDVNNFSDSPKWTKVCAEDIISGKPTYPVITALKRLSGKKQDRLRKIVGSESLRVKPELVAEAVDLIRSSGALEECRENAKRMIRNEWRYFSKHVKSSESKIMLRMMCSSLLNISYETS